MHRTTTFLLAGLLLTSGISAAEAAKTCKSLYKGGGSGYHPAEAMARTAAMAGWTTGAAVKYTPKFANWSNASIRKVSCVTRTSPIGANAFSCKAQAKPCAYD